MRTFAVKTFLLAAFFGVGAVGAFPGEVLAQASVAPTLIPIGGVLRTAEGQPRSGESVQLVISLYDRQDDTLARWVEQQSVTLDAAGGYAVQFGVTLPDGLPLELFAADTGARWLGVAVQNADGSTVEQPRAMLVSVPYAAKAASAETLAGKSASEFVLASTFRDDVRAVIDGDEGGGGSDDVSAQQVINEDLTVNGRLTVTGFGTHSFTAGGAGLNRLTMRNTTAGAGNFAGITFGNDADANLSGFYGFSSSYTPAGSQQPNGAELQANGAGGLSVSASHASGAIRFYSGGSSERLRIDSGGRLTVSGFGSHAFSAGGAGVNRLTMRNTSAGTGNFAGITFGNDADANLSGFYGFSSSYTPAGSQQPNGSELQANGAGGLSINASHIAGALRVYTGSSERVRVDAAGNVGIGTATPTSKLHVVGTAFVSGDMTVNGNIAAKYQDVAEWVDSDEPLEAGTVVIIDVDARNRVKKSTRQNDTRVAGAVSPQPGLILGEPGEGRVLVAQSGRVRIKADTRNGAIKPGDLLVTSPLPGHAMKAKSAKAGTVLGKALEPLEKGTGEILVLLTLQ